MPQGTVEQLTTDGDLTSPHALAPVLTHSEHVVVPVVPGLYFVDAGNLCWLDRFTRVVTTVRAHVG